jgi:hypothetical protein
MTSTEELARNLKRGALIGKVTAESRKLLEREGASFHAKACAISFCARDDLDAVLRVLTDANRTLDNALPETLA